MAPQRRNQITREAVASMLAKGHSVRRISARLLISTQAVYKHKKALDRQTK